MKLYAAYIKEREGLDIFYDDHCFITFKIDEDDVIVYDIYSDNNVRGKGHMLEFCNKFFDSMKENGMKVAYGFTNEKTNGWKHSDSLLKKYGFKFLGKDPEDNKMNNYVMDLGE